MKVNISLTNGKEFSENFTGIAVDVLTKLRSDIENSIENNILNLQYTGMYDDEGYVLFEVVSFTIEEEINIKLEYSGTAK